MRKIILWIASFSFYTMGACAQSEMFTFPLSNLNVFTGYRHDNFGWSIDGPRHFARELWSMNFNDIQLWQVGVSYHYTTCNNYYVRLSGDYAKIISGHSRAIGHGHPRHDHDGDNDNDSDESFHQHHRKRQFSNIKGRKDDGYVYDIEGCVGYSFTSNGRRFVGTPVLGWSWHYQYLRTHDGEQTYNNPSNDPLINDPVTQGRVGDIYGLRASYDPRWFGPFIGLDWIVTVEPCFILYGRAQWHFAEQYRANGRWNLKYRELLNFSHHSHGRGLTVTLGGDYHLSNGFFLGVEGEYRNFQTGKGKHQTTKNYTSTSDEQVFGRMPIVKKSRFRGAKWNSYSVEFSLTYRYWCGV